MANQLDYRRLTKESYPEAPGWISRVFDTINLFNEQVVSALNRNLTFGSNVVGQVYTITVNTPSDYGVGGFNPADLNWPFIKRVDGILLLTVTPIDGSTITTGTHVDWSQRSQNTLRINYIAGLSANTKYAVSLLAI